MSKDRFITCAKANHLSPKTRKNYWSFIDRYIKWLNVDSAFEAKDHPNSTESIRKYLSELANQNVSASTQNCAFYALKFYYEKVCGIKLGDLSGIPRANGKPRIVCVPDESTARAILDEAKGLAGVALKLIYATGSRLSDVLNLKVKDLDFTKKLISIHHGKGDKSRLLPMPSTMLQGLVMTKSLTDREPNSFLFSNDKGRKPICAMTLQREFAAAKKKCGIKENYTIHSLRHAAAQFWESKGVERSRIQLLLGHTHSRTTDRYLVSGVKTLAGIPSPI